MDFGHNIMVISKSKDAHNYRFVQKHDFCEMEGYIRYKMLTMAQEQFTRCLF